MNGGSRLAEGETKTAGPETGTYGFGEIKLLRVR